MEKLGRGLGEEKGKCQSFIFVQKIGSTGAHKMRLILIKST